MNAHIFQIAGQVLHALPSGGLHFPDDGVFCVSDLHLGKSDRIARRSGTLIPPYENRATLDKLSDDLDRTAARTVICLGDSFDDLAGAEALHDVDRQTLIRMQAGRRWIWIEGNHDPGPVDLGGTHIAEWQLNGIHFRHIATTATPEVSGHYHPKHGVPGAGRARACFVYDQQRLMLPAYGAYTGGLSAQDPVIRSLFSGTPIAVLTGTRAIALPVK